MLDCAQKAKLFNDYFSQQCKPILNDSQLPPLFFHTEKKLDNIAIVDDDIVRALLVLVELNHP